MASHTIALNYPDGQQARILSALKAAATTIATPAPTNAQALAWLNEQVRAKLRNVVFVYEQGLAAATAAAAADAALAGLTITPINVT